MLGRHSNLSVSRFVRIVGATGEASSEIAAPHKEDKYSSIDGRYLFETIRDFRRASTSARQLLCDLGRMICQCSGEVRETNFLFQRCSILMQRFNAVLLHSSLPASDCMD